MNDVPIEDYFNERMKDPEFAKAYAEVKSEFDNISRIVWAAIFKRQKAAKNGKKRQKAAKNGKDD